MLQRDDEDICQHLIFKHVYKHNKKKTKITRTVKALAYLKLKTNKLVIKLYVYTLFPDFYILLTFTGHSALFHLFCESIILFQIKYTLYRCI